MAGGRRITNVVAAIALVSTLGACTTTTTDNYNECAIAWGAMGLGVGLLSSGTGVVVAGAAGGAGLGYLICGEEPPKVKTPRVVPVTVASAPEPEPIGDSDSDGVFDDRDECPGTPAGVEVDYKGCAKPLVFDSRVLQFEFNKANLPADAADILAPVLKALEAYPESKFEVAGHTDAVGSDAYNLELSTRRATAVQQKLIAMGVSAQRLTAVGYGEAMPISTNETESGRARNRRVEVRLMD